jgi:hypothetical protein
MKSGAGFARRCHCPPSCWADVGDLKPGGKKCRLDFYAERPSAAGACSPSDYLKKGLGLRTYSSTPKTRTPAVASATAGHISASGEYHKLDLFVNIFL